MSFLKNIFGKNNAGNSTNGALNSIPFSAPSEDQLLKNLFVNPEPPVNEPVEAAANGISAFLDQDFFSKGYNDGYTSHSADTMKNQVDVIKAEFRLMMSRKIDEIRQEMLEMENHLINIDGVEERLEKQVQKRLEYLLEMKNDLEAEKALSALDEGMVMASVHKYREGFVRGLQTYQEEKMLASSTGMFN